MREQRRAASDLRDIFGWSLPFGPDDLPGDILAILERGDLLRRESGRLRSKVRASTVEGLLFLHSAYPTTAADAVFLGPDSYRFARLILDQDRGRAPRRIADIGAGAGVGGLVSARLGERPEVVLTDLNAEALRLARANAAHAGIEVSLRQGPGLSAAEGGFDLIVANPPFIAGSPDQTYKDGGDLHGSRISLDWAIESMTRLNPGGRIVLYTGSPILSGGEDRFLDHLAAAAREAGCALDYRELDPDIFSSELSRDAYAEVERIAAVGAVIRRPG